MGESFDLSKLKRVLLTHFDVCLPYLRDIIGNFDDVVLSGVHYKSLSRIGERVFSYCTQGCASCNEPVYTVIEIDFDDYDFGEFILFEHEELDGLTLAYWTTDAALCDDLGNDNGNEIWFPISDYDFKEWIQNAVSTCFFDACVSGCATSGALDCFGLVLDRCIEYWLPDSHPRTSICLLHRGERCRYLAYVVRCGCFSVVIVCRHDAAVAIQCRKRELST